jgi:hypothetical protein
MKLISLAGQVRQVKVKGPCRSTHQLKNGGHVKLISLARQVRQVKIKDPCRSTNQ